MNVFSVEQDNTEKSYHECLKTNYPSGKKYLLSFLYLKLLVSLLMSLLTVAVGHCRMNCIILLN